MTEATTGPSSGDGRTVALVGLGNMGGPMAGRLVAAGHTVLGYDVDPSRAAGIEGVTPAASAEEAARTADIVILMLPNSDVVDAVAATLVGVMPEGAVVLDMSSSHPVRTRELAARLAAQGHPLVDAPVSGGVSGAENGTLAIMVGGEKAPVEAVLPVLEVLGRPSVVGPVGAGHALKALNNLMSAAHLVVSSEALLAGERFGLDIETMLGVVNAGSGRSGSTEAKWPKFIVPGTYDSGFAMSLMVKDIGIGLDLIREGGVDAGPSAAVVDAWRQAVATLEPNADHTEVARWVRSLAPATDTDTEE
jgi:3-hydroxyisobutyrate dehydrogenase